MRFCTSSIIARGCTSSIFSPRRECWATTNLELEHVSFGTVLGDDGKPFKTRSGDTVGLESLLDEAVRRAGEIVAANDDAKPDGPELSPERRAEIAEIVGIGALKYADLSQNRTSDYVFSYDKMLAMNGNTATYMQYAYARVRSIFAKGNVDADALRASGAKILLTHPAERALAMEILRFSEALELAVVRLSPQPTDRLSLRVGQSLLHLLRKLPRAERRNRRTPPKPAVALRFDRPDDSKRIGAVGDSRGGEDVANTPAACGLATHADANSLPLRVASEQTFS